MGLLWAIYNMTLVLKVNVKEGITGDDKEDANGRDIPL